MSGLRGEELWQFCNRALLGLGLQVERDEDFSTLACAPKELHEQRLFALHRGSMHHALDLARRLGMDQHIAALLQGLASHALNSRDHAGAAQLSAELAEHGRHRNDPKVEAAACHQLGRVAKARRDFATAGQWHGKSLAIEEKLGNEHGAASSYHQLGMVALKQRDFTAAEQCCKKSLAIEEKLGDEHGAALTYANLGLLSGERQQRIDAGRWLLKAAGSFAASNDRPGMVRAMAAYARNLLAADPEVQTLLRQQWQQAGLGQVAALEQLEEMLNEQN